MKIMEPQRGNGLESTTNVCSGALMTPRNLSNINSIPNSSRVSSPRPLVLTKPDVNNEGINRSSDERGESSYAYIHSSQSPRPRLPYSAISAVDDANDSNNNSTNNGNSESNVNINPDGNYMTNQYGILSQQYQSATNLHQELYNQSNLHLTSPVPNNSSSSAYHSNGHDLQNLIRGCSSSPYGVSSSLIHHLGNRRNHSESSSMIQEYSNASSPSPPPQCSIKPDPDLSNSEVCCSSSNSSSNGSRGSGETAKLEFDLDQINCICAALLDKQDMERLCQLMCSLPKKFLSSSDKILKARAVAAYYMGDFPEVYRILESREFPSEMHAELQKLWKDAHYKEAEKIRGKALGPVDKYRIRKKFPLPRTIWDGDELVYCFKQKSRNILNEFYNNFRYPSNEQKKYLQSVTFLSENQIQNWFKNKRQRDRSTPNFRETRTKPRLRNQTKRKKRSPIFPLRLEHAAELEGLGSDLDENASRRLHIQDCRNLSNDIKPDTATDSFLSITKRKRSRVKSIPKVTSYVASDQMSPFSLGHFRNDYPLALQKSDAAKNNSMNLQSRFGHSAAAAAAYCASANAQAAVNGHFLNTRPHSIAGRSFSPQNHSVGDPEDDFRNSATPSAYHGCTPSTNPAMIQNYFQTFNPSAYENNLALIHSVGGGGGPTSSLSHLAPSPA